MGYIGCSGPGRFQVGFHSHIQHASSVLNFLFEDKGEMENVSVTEFEDIEESCLSCQIYFK